MSARRPSRAPASAATVAVVLLVSLGALVLVSPRASAVTYVRGPILSDTTWGLSDSTYVLTGHVTVIPGVTLTILPGTTVRMDPNIALYVDGALYADGSPGNEIIFEANRTLSLFSPVGVQYNASSAGSVTWSSFTRFQRAVAIVDSAPTIRFNTFRTATYGVALWSSGIAPVDPLVADNKIEQASVGVFMSGASAQILRNTINDTTVGIESFIGGTPIIANNTITNVTSWFAIGIWAGGGPSPQIRGNVIQGVTGIRGGNALFPGADGGSGGFAIGMLLESLGSIVVEDNTINMLIGGNGGNGAPLGLGVGGRGGEGGSVAGIVVSSTPTVQVERNVVSNLFGGRGGDGGTNATTSIGGDGGLGGSAIGIQIALAGTSARVYSSTVGTVVGGMGGSGGSGTKADGNGTAGGDATGIFFLEAMDADATANSVSGLVGGLGGNSSASGIGVGRSGGGGDATAFMAFGVVGTAMFHSNDVSSVLAGDGGRARPRGGPGGNATGILAFSNNDGYFNLTSPTFNRIEGVTGGNGGIGLDRGGDAGSASGIALAQVTAILGYNGILTVRGGNGGDALDGTGGGRGGDAGGIFAFYIPDAQSTRDRIETVTKGAAGAGPPAQTARGVGLYSEGSPAAANRMTIDNGTFLGVSDLDLYMNNFTEATTINTTFDEAKLTVEVTANLTVRNYLRVDVFWPDGVTLVANSSILVEDNGTPVWNFTSSTGSEPWLLVTDRVYTNSNLATENATDVDVSYLAYNFNNNPRSVNMNASVTEAFVMIDEDVPTSALAALPVYTNSWSLTVNYTASDGNGVGLDNITLWYRLDGAGWISYATQTAASSGQFNFTAASDGVYEFTSVADDLAGNVEPGPGANDTWTILDTVRPGSHVDPLGTWQTSASFLVSWMPDANVTDIVSYSVQYNRGSGWVDWLVDTTLTNSTFTASPAWGVYEFRSIATDIAGNVEVAPPTNDTWTIVDTESPASRVSSLSTYQTSLTFPVVWGPQFDSVDIATYEVQVNDDGTGWTVWIASTNATSANFTGVDGHVYEFRSVATDFAGNVEAPPAGNDTWTLVDVTPPDSTVAALQAYYTTLSFTVSWGPAIGTTDIATYTLEVSDNSGPWTPVSGSIDTSATSALYVGVDGHTYAFRTLARDQAGNVETAPAGNDTWTIVDTTRPFASSPGPEREHDPGHHDHVQRADGPSFRGTGFLSESRHERCLQLERGLPNGDLHSGSCLGAGYAVRRVYRLERQRPCRKQRGVILHLRLHDNNASACGLRLQRHVVDSRSNRRGGRG